MSNLERLIQFMSGILKYIWLPASIAVFISAGFFVHPLIIKIPIILGAITIFSAIGKDIYEGKF